MYYVRRYKYDETRANFLKYTARTRSYKIYLCKYMTATAAADFDSGNGRRS